MMVFLAPLSLLILGFFFFTPIISGGVFTLLSAWGQDFFQPCSINSTDDCHTQAFLELFSHPQFLPSLHLTLRTSLISTALSLSLVFIIVGGWSREISRIAKTLPIWLAYPHVAFSIGLVFLISPSGLLVRWLGYPWGIEIPPDWTTYQDPFGFSLIIGLVFKETVFLLFMAFSQMSQVKVSLSYQVARSLGYSPAATWSKIIWQQVYRGIRFPFLIVLSYSFSAVDMGLILAGNTPPPFAVLIFKWFQDPNLSYSRLSSAGAIILIVVYGLAVLGWWLGEKSVAHLNRLSIFRGSRKSTFPIEFAIGPYISTALFSFLSLTFFLSFAMNVIWSFTRSWSFPTLLPTRYTLQAWSLLQHDLLLTLYNTFSLAAVSVFLSIFIAIIILEMRFSPLATINLMSPLNYSASRALIFLPLLLPAMSLFINIRVFFLTVLPTLPIWWTTMIGHFLMTFPYTLLTLEKAYYSFNQQYFVIAQTLSRSNLRSYFRIKFPMLKKPLLSSIAIAASVSIMDYLATAVLSGGLIATTTTEAVQLSGGGNLRVMGFFAVVQTLILLLIFISCFNFTLFKSIQIKD